MTQPAPRSAQDNDLPWWLILIGLAIAFSPTYLNRLVARLGAEWGWLSGPPSILIWNWLAVFLLFAFMIGLERTGPSSIRLVKPGVKDIAWAIAFWVISVLVTSISHTWLPPADSDGLDTLLSLSLPTLMLIVITASITEEILFRGYAIERLATLTGSVFLAAATSFVLFILPHLAFFGPSWLLYHGFSVVLIYVLYVWRRNLWACILLHLLGNMLILLPALGVG